MLQVKENRILRTEHGRESSADFMARRLDEIRPDFIDEFLNDSIGLVPMPRSTPTQKGALWPAMELAEALHRRGFGSDVLPILKRERPVMKSATAASKDRPKARAHLDSLTASSAFIETELTLIDDVVTRGATFVGAAGRILSLRGVAAVRAFAVIRTISDPDDFETIRAPCIGTIQLRGEDCYRSP